MATFYLEALENMWVAVNAYNVRFSYTIKYGINDNTVPNNYSISTRIQLTAGQKCYFTCSVSKTSITAGGYLYFSSSGNFNVGGNISDFYIDVGSSAVSSDQFKYLFYNCDGLISARNLNLDYDPSGSTYCYRGLFCGCEYLVEAPNLSDVPVGFGVFGHMFQDCKRLKNAPALPSMELAYQCYIGMFYNCQALETPPELPATTLTDSCYSFMFWGCRSLKTLPALPATTLAFNCYFKMFMYCYELETLPALPATYLPISCYAGMFYGCSKIKVSETLTGDYNIPFTIPSSGVGEEETEDYSTEGMFIDTGGTFTGSPKINRTYYLHGGSVNSNIKLGQSNVDKTYLGNNAVKRIYLGSNLIYQGD